MDIYTATVSTTTTITCKLNRTHNFSITTSTLNKLILNDSEVAIGCKDTNFGVYDLNEGELKWQAKAYLPDELNLQQKVDVVDVKHINNGVYYNLSAYDRVYKYDIRAQRKEVADFETKLDPEFSTTCFDIKGNLMAVANNIGSINLFDIRRTKNPLKKFNDHEGSVKHLQFHHSDNKLVSGSHDRFMHIYNTETHNLDKKYFVSQKIERVCVSQRELKYTRNYDIEEVFEDVADKKDTKKRDFYRTALKQEEMLWHNNVPLPYQKKIKRA